MARRPPSQGSGCRSYRLGYRWGGRSQSEGFLSGTPHSPGSSWHLYHGKSPARRSGKRSGVRILVCLSATQNARGDWLTDTPDSTRPLAIKLHGISPQVAFCASSSEVERRPAWGGQSKKEQKAWSFFGPFSSRCSR